MNPKLTCDDMNFILEKQKQIREKGLKKIEIQKQLNGLYGEIEFLDADIESYRYSIRRKIGRD